MGLNKEAILVFNAGSSSLKCALFAKGNKAPIWKIHTQTSQESLMGIFESLSPLQKEIIGAVGHRVVHGGEAFVKTTLITPEMKKILHSLSPLAPLHNPVNLEVIEAAQSYFSDVPHFAAFDTAFHADMPEVAATYPLPYAWKKEGIRRYGFHGISFQYCTKAAAEFLNRSLDSMNMVICHLGAGSSLCAVQNGKSIDTTMGFTPMEGVMMSTRCGSIDPGILLYLLQNKKTTLEQLDQDLNFQSGLLGVSGESGDIRELSQRASEGHTRSLLALKLYLHSLISHLGAMIASSGGIDLLIFTGGVGEHDAVLRSKTAQAFAYLGLILDESKNLEECTSPQLISSSTSKIQVLVIPTQEEWEIACECWKLKEGLNQPLMGGCEVR